MDASWEQAPNSLWKRAARWIGAFDTASDMQAVDYLELRVAHLERRMAALHDSKPGVTASKELRLQAMGER